MSFSWICLMFPKIYSGYCGTCPSHLHSNPQSKASLCYIARSYLKFKKKKKNSFQQSHSLCLHMQPPWSSRPQLLLHHWWLLHLCWLLQVHRVQMHLLQEENLAAPVPWAVPSVPRVVSAKRHLTNAAAVPNVGTVLLPRVNRVIVENWIYFFSYNWNLFSTFLFLWSMWMIIKVDDWKMGKRIMLSLWILTTNTTEVIDPSHHIILGLHVINRTYYWWC
jgi:hypothetical protein